MSNIFGYISRSKAPIRPDIASQMQQASYGWNPDRTDTWSQPDIILGCALLHTTNESLTEVLPFTDREAQLTITADARIDNRAELSSILGLPDHVNYADSIFILRAYQKWGNACCQHLLGDYAFAIWDHHKHELFCARDHIGARALYYYEDKEKFIFATEPKIILATGKVPEKLQEDWIANILINVHPAKDMAPFEQMKKLPAAHYMLVTPDKILTKRYWYPDITREIRYKREQDYYDEMRMLMEQAIRSCTRSAFPVGAELSGGLDSSGIAAMAHHELLKQGKEVSTYSHALPEWAEGKIYPYIDEKQFIKSLCTHAGITQQHYVTAEQKGILDEFRLCRERFGYPTGYQLPVFCDSLYEKAQSQGVRILLSGFPGDELVTSHGMGFFNELLSHHRYRLLWNMMYHRMDRDFFKTVYTSGGRALRYHAPGIYQLLKSRKEEKTDWRGNSFRCSVATDDFIEKMHLYQRLLDSTTYPIFNSVRERERARITETFVCHRLGQCATHALYYHLEYRNPFSDRRLLEYVLALPPEIKVHPKFTRYPYRMAIAGIVPEEIQWRKDKTRATIPTVMLRIIKDSDHINHLLLHATDNKDWLQYVSIEKMKRIKQSLDNQQMDTLYLSSFYSALMLHK